MNDPPSPDAAPPPPVGRKTTAEQYRGYERLFRRWPFRGLYLWGFVCMATGALGAALNLLSPRAGDALGTVVGVGMFAFFAFIVVGSFAAAARQSREAPLPPQSMSPWPVPESLPAGPAAVPPAASAGAPFGETAGAQAARLEELHAGNAMVRAQRVSTRPPLVLTEWILFGGGPIALLGVALIGVGSIVAISRGIIHPSPKDTVGGGVAMVAQGVLGWLALNRFVLSPRRAVQRRMAALAARLGGTTAAGHGTTMLDWLDRHWADGAPSSGLVGLGWHVVLTFTHQGRPALLSAIHDFGARGFPRTRRIDLYLPEPMSAPRLDDAAVARARALGYGVVQSPAGVRFERRDDDLAALTPAVVDELLAIGRAPAESR